MQKVLAFEQFELMETVDAWSIIALSVAIGTLVKDARPILAMSMGFAVASASWLLMWASPSLEAAVVAMIFFAVGEAMQAPRFYEYVAALAPREQVGTFMGFAFLPVAIGALVAGPLSGWLVARFVNGSEGPGGMWLVLSGIGFASTILMLLYDRFVTPHQEAA